MDRRTLICNALSACAAVITDRHALAESLSGYPDRMVRVILPFVPGGATDQMARIASEMLSVQLGKAFIVESKLGAGGLIGSSLVARSPADGYTLLVASASAITIAPFMRINPPYNPEKDLQPIVMLGDSPIAVVVRRESPYNSLEQLINAAKAQPELLSFGSAGVGTAAHLGGELFKWRAGVNLLHVPYQGVSPSLVDVLAGRIDVMFVNYSVVHPQVQAGKLRVLAIAAKKRMSALPAYPTAAELGVSGYFAGNWNGLMAPANTPKVIIEKLNAIVVKGFRDPVLLARMAEMGMDPVTGTPEEFSQHIRQEVAQMRALIRAMGIKQE